MSIEPQPPFVYRWRSHFVVADSLDHAWEILTARFCVDLPAGVTAADAIAHYTATDAYDVDPAKQMRWEVKGLENGIDYCLEARVYDLRARECLHRVPNDDWVEIDERTMPGLDINSGYGTGVPRNGYTTVTAEAADWAAHYQEGYIGGNDPNA